MTLTQIEVVLARALTGAPVETAIDEQGQYITRTSAKALAELISTDVMDVLEGDFRLRRMVRDLWGDFIGSVGVA